MIKTERSWRSDYFSELMMICQLDCIKYVCRGPQAKLYVSNWIKKVEAEPGLTRNKCDKVFLLEPQVSISSA